MLELITAVAAVATVLVAIGPSVRRWWREHYRHPSWVDAWLHRRQQKAALREALREAEKDAPGLLMELQRSLVEDPGRRQFRVLQGNRLIITASSVDDPIDYTHDGAGDLEGWVAQHADGLLFQLVPWEQPARLRDVGGAGSVPERPWGGDLLLLSAARPGPRRTADGLDPPRTSGGGHGGPAGSGAPEGLS